MASDDDDDDDNKRGSGSVILIGFLIILSIVLGYWVLGEINQTTYKYSFGTSDFSYKPAAALMSV